ncbi:DUF6225 family protein (plasmid) [Streptomyces sp. NBC_01454]|nr:DUF6225 family protein [Streptomyces sp. NBC_01454]
MTDTFEHAPRVWTAGQLRDALDSVPHDTPVSIGVADGPGDFDWYSHFVLVGFETGIPNGPPVPGCSRRAPRWTTC